MSEGRLEGKRILVTQANDYMGPPTIKLFREEGAEVIADNSDLTQPDAAQKLIKETGHIDVLVANLSADANLGVMAVDTDDDIWHRAFDMMVHPLHRLCRAVLPDMYKRRNGKIVVYGSATGVKALEGVTAYAAARSAQVGYVRNTGAEAARHNVQINLIAQNFVENPAYFSPRNLRKRRNSNSCCKPFRLDGSLQVKKMQDLRFSWRSMKVISSSANPSLLTAGGRNKNDCYWDKAETVGRSEFGAQSGKAAFLKGFGRR